MKSNATFLDKKILFVFIATFLVSSGVLAYRVATVAPCNEVVFATAEKQYKAGELVKFLDATEGAKTWQWDFGDSTSVSSVVAPLHIYKNPGEYTVTLKVNNSCYLSKNIVISEKEKLVDPSIFPVFELPETIAFGEVLTVVDETKDATSWEWRFGETASVNAVTQTATYEFDEPGLKTVSLIVNGNIDNITHKKINVLPPVKKEVELTQLSAEKPKGWNIKYKPSQTVTEEDNENGVEKSAPTVVPFISDIEFERRLMLVVDGKMKAKDFSEYFCGDLNRTVLENGNNTTFSALCDQINGKKLKIKSLKIFRDRDSNCIKNITIEHKKRGWF